jgi:DNA-directed RNA polymerase specialized sigma24 family protein
MAHWMKNMLSARQAGSTVAAFEVLFDHHYNMIHAFAYRVYLVEAEAEDIAQETFLRAARGISNYCGIALVENRLYRIADNPPTDLGWQAVRQRDKQDHKAWLASEHPVVSDYSVRAQTLEVSL